VNATGINSGDKVVTVLTVEEKSDTRAYRRLSVSVMLSTTADALQFLFCVQLEGRFHSRGLHDGNWNSNRVHKCTNRGEYHENDVPPIVALYRQVCCEI
jgi:hypothetical protein